MTRLNNTSIWFLLVLACSCSPKDNHPVVAIEQAEGPNPWTNLQWNNKAENFQFVIVTDRTGGNRPGVFKQGMEKVNLLQPEFVMSVGDLIQGYTEDLDEVNRQWDEFDGLVNQLEMPFFYVPGNHDITNAPMEELWNQRYGRTYYHFVYKNVLFLCLNSEEPIYEEGQPVYHTGDYYLSQDQRDYIRQTLQDNQEVRWTFVFWHKPVWLYAESDNPIHRELVPKSGWPEVKEMLSGRRHTVFAGHIHRYVHQEIDNADYITLATTGGGSALRGPVFGQFDHVLWVTMTDDGPVMANLLLNGIFDKDFKKDDIEKHLTLSMQNKVVRVDSKFNFEQVSENKVIELTLFNNLDVPAICELEFTNSEHVTYSENQISVTIPPNGASSTAVSLSIADASDSSAIEDLVKEVRGHNASWNLTYDFEKYGKIQVSGQTWLLR